MRIPRVLAVTAIVLLIPALALSGCSRSDKNTLRVGLITPLTGDVKTFGESTKNGVLLAWEQAGVTLDKGGKVGNVPVKLFVQDDRNDATEGVNVATKLISETKVQAIIGSVTSKVTIAVSNVTNPAKVVQLTSTATNPKVTVEDGKRKPYTFRACFIDPFQGTVGAKFALDNLKAKTAAMLYDQSNDYTVGLAQYFKESFEKGGGKVVFEASYGTNDTDFSAVLTKIAGFKPDILYLPDSYQ
ncbi:MAG: ABC transporter substrate-binding protein, partial [Bacillota bacterium]